MMINRIMNKPVAAVLLLLVINTALRAQDNGGNTQNDNSLYIVMAITLLTWIALSLYIFILNKKVKSLEKKLIKDE